MVDFAYREIVRSVLVLNGGLRPAGASIQPSVLPAIGLVARPWLDAEEANRHTSFGVACW